MKKLKILQDWPLLHNGKALKRGFATLTTR